VTAASAPARTTATTLAGATIFCAGMIVLGLAAHREAMLPIRIAAAIAAAGGVAAVVAVAESPRRLAGIRRAAGAGAWLPPALVLAVLLAAAYRDAQGLPPLPLRVTAWALAAAAIGAAEEVSFRGLVQGSLERVGSLLAILLAAAAHASYKTALFVYPDQSVRADLIWLFSATLATGVVLGLARWRTGSVLVPVLAHVAFDLAAYGDASALPWWVR
jgi:membrane protease YdiL (CAAX protease family)